MMSYGHMPHPPYLGKKASEVETLYAAEGNDQSLAHAVSAKEMVIMYTLRKSDLAERNSWHKGCTAMCPVK